MKKVLVLVALLALVPAAIPAKGSALTLGQRVSRLEAKAGCLQRIPVVEFGDYAWYGDPDPDTGPNAPTYLEDSGNPDSLVDVGAAFGVDFGYGYNPSPPPNYVADAWLIAIKNTATCRSRFGVAPNPLAARPAASKAAYYAKMARVRQ
jgi:hypothetical protein